MNTKTNKSMKMSFFTVKPLLIKAKFVWKTLVVVLLSLLLFVPTPVLALDSNSTPQSYLSDFQAEVDGVVTSIRKLPSLSYDEGQKTLVEIDHKLQTIKANVGDSAKQSKFVSDQYQKQLEAFLDIINHLNTNQEKLTLATLQKELVQTKHELELIYRLNPNYQIWAVAYGAPLPLQYNQITKLEQEILSIQSGIQSQEEQKRKLEIGNKLISEQLVSSSQISQFYSNLEKRINLAIKKAGKIKEYGSEFQSFNQPDVVNESSELEKILAPYESLTNKVGTELDSIRTSIKNLPLNLDSPMGRVRLKLLNSDFQKLQNKLNNVDFENKIIKEAYEHVEMIRHELDELSDRNYFNDSNGLDHIHLLNSYFQELTALIKKIPNRTAIQ